MKLLRPFVPTKPSLSVAPIPSTLQLVQPGDHDWWTRNYSTDSSNTVPRHVYRLSAYNVHVIRNKKTRRVIGAAGVMHIAVPKSMPNGDKLTFADIEQLASDPDRWYGEDPDAAFLAMRAYEADSNRHDRLNRAPLTDDPKFDARLIDFSVLPSLAQSPAVPPNANRWYRFTGYCSL
jgi:hypothetical protein